MSSRTGKIQSAWTATGSTLYAIVRNAIAQAWNVGGAAFEVFNVANWSQYAVAMTEQGALSQFYVADLPAGAESYYTATVYEQAGVGPAVADTLVDVIRAVQLADDVPHGGVLAASTASIAVQQFNVTNPTGNACTMMGGDGSVGLTVGSGVGGIGLEVNGDNLGVSINASTGNGIEVSALGTGSTGISVTGDTQAVNITGAGGNGIGVFIDGFVNAVQAVSTSGAVLQIGDGSNGGIGLNILAGAGSGTGAAGVNIVGNLQGDGVDITGGATDATGMVIAKGGTLGNALVISGGQHAILLETINSSVILANGNNTFMTANLVGGHEYLRVNSAISIDNVGRHRLWSSLTFDDVLPAFPFLMTDLAGNPMTGLAVTSTVILDGSPPVPTANSPVEVGNGIYTIDLTASDRAGTTMMLRLTAPNARDLDITIINTA